MQPWHFIVSDPADGPGNMAADEALLDAVAAGNRKTPVFRLYSWTKPCVTIGYFQKIASFTGQNISVTRRLTGGLSVLHGQDISYAFIASKAEWQYLYDQEKTYERIHAGIKEGLDILGIKSDFCEGDNKANTGNGICVQTLYPYDLRMAGKKILGSCQRRRGSVLLQQGSLHIRFTERFEAVAAALEQGMAKILGISFERSSLGEYEQAVSRKLMEEKYSSDVWNDKF